MYRVLHFFLLAIMMLHGYHILFTSSSLDGHWGCFHLLNILDNAALHFGTGFCVNMFSLEILCKETSKAKSYKGEGILHKKLNFLCRTCAGAMHIFMYFSSPSKVTFHPSCVSFIEQSWCCNMKLLQIDTLGFLHEETEAWML